MRWKRKCQGNSKHCDEVSRSDKIVHKDEMRLCEVFDMVLGMNEGLEWRQEFCGQ